MFNNRNKILYIIFFLLLCVTIQVLLFKFIFYKNAGSLLKLVQMVILSRHNIRTPLSKNLGRMTPQVWPVWKEKPGYLTEKGYILEGYMGKYFSKWLNNERLLPMNCPSKEDFYVYANTKQRTIYSAKAFVNECFANCNITIHHSDIDKPDPVFSPFIHNSSSTYKEIALEEMINALNHLNLNKSYSVLEDILKYKQSDLCKKENKCDFASDINEFNISVGQKPSATGPLKIGNEAIDAFLMAYYNGFTEEDVAWGKLKHIDSWHSILNITTGYHNVTFCTKHIAMDLARPLIQYLTNIFLNRKTKVTLLMGHDINLNVILNAMQFQPHVLSDNFISTPVGGKIVFQKWFDEEANDYLLKIQYVYQTNKQLREGLILSDDNPPKLEMLELKHCKTDNRGFCKWNKFVSFIKDLLFV